MTIWEENIKGQRSTEKVGGKGIAITTAIVILAGWLLLMSAIMYYTMTEFKHTTMVVREVEILEGAELMESIKRGMEDAIEYSLHRATYEVFATGGYCEHGLGPDDPGYCGETCLIPADVPTTECVPWWRQYDDIWTPGTVNLRRYVSDKVHQNIQEYAEAYEDIDDGLEIPDYCPSDAESGDITNSISDTSSSLVRIKPGDPADDITLERNSFTITEGPYFRSEIDTTAFALYEFAYDKFITNDYIEDAFGKGRDMMPSEWCEMDGEDYCDISGGDCDKDCWDGNCCCKGVSIGPACEDDMPDCDELLDQYCSSGSGEDKITATYMFSENMKNNFEGQEETDAYGNTFTISLSGDDPYSCVNTDVTSDLTRSGGTTVRASDNLPADSPECIKVNKYCKGADDKCENGEGCSKPSPSCSDSGGCPAVPDCEGACGYWTCSDGPEYECNTCTICTDVYECNTCTICTDIKETRSGCPPCPWSIETIIVGGFPEKVNKCNSPCEVKVDEVCDTVTDCDACGQTKVDEVCDTVTDCDACGRTQVGYDCDWDWHCRVETCGHDCWQKTKTVYDDVKCDFEYFGSAALKATVSDEEHEFYIDDSKENLVLTFYVAGGDRAQDRLECDITTTDDSAAWQWCKAS